MHCKNIVQIALQIERNANKPDKTNQTKVHLVTTDNDQKNETTKIDNKEVKFSFSNHGETVPYFP